MNKNGGLYNNWLRQFTITVFTQTFHAFMLMLVIMLLSSINQVSENREVNTFGSMDGILAIISIIGMMAIIKFEKLFKQLFGIQDSFAGDLKGAGAKLLMGIQAGKGLYDKTAAPFKKNSESKKKVNSLGDKLSSKGIDIGKKGYIDKKAAMKDYDEKNNIGTNIDAQAANSIRETLENARNGTASGGENISSNNQQYVDSNANSNEPRRKSASELDREERLRDKREAQIDEYNAAVRDSKVSRRDRWLNTAGTVASLSIGMGAADEWHEVAGIANIINQPISAATTKYAEHGENKVAYKKTGEGGKSNQFYARTLKEAIKEGFSGVSKDFKTKNDNINVAKVAVAPAIIIKNVVTTKKEVKPPRTNNIDEI